jgi:hypothetical protein
MDTDFSHDTSTTPTESVWEREQALQATYSATDLLQESYTNLNPPSATSIGEGDGRFDPCYVTNDCLRHQGSAEPMLPVAPLQYTPYRKPQPLSPSRYLPYRQPQREDMQYRPGRDQQGVLRLRLALQAYATARFGRRYVRGELLGMRVRPVGRSTVAQANYEP